MAKVWNKRESNIPKDAIYVGRPSVWGNPFSHLRDTLAKHKVETRIEAVNSYVEWLWSKDGVALFKRLPELKGKDLVCWCKPELCHGDELEALANHDGKDCAKCGEQFDEWREQLSYYGVATCRPCIEEVLSDR